jgi:hypothetical protein
MTTASHLLGHHDANPYFAFTDACNAQRPVVILASGQACVWYHLTLASKDGDWIVREDEAALSRVRDELSKRGARYRLGAPLDVRWLSGGWSSHFESIDAAGIRYRYDFVSRPPRLSPSQLRNVWSQIDSGAPAVVPKRELILLKQTLRLKDYPFIGVLATQLNETEDQLRWTLDPQHMMDLLAAHPELISKLAQIRPAMHQILRENAPRNLEALGVAIDAEIRNFRRDDEQRVMAYTTAMQSWATRFRALDIDHLSLSEAHQACCNAARDILPYHVVAT